MEAGTVLTIGQTYYTRTSDLKTILEFIPVGNGVDRDIWIHAISEGDWMERDIEEIEAHPSHFPQVGDQVRVNIGKSHKRGILKKLYGTGLKKGYVLVTLEKHMQATKFLAFYVSKAKKEDIGEWELVTNVMYKSRVAVRKEPTIDHGQKELYELASKVADMIEEQFPFHPDEVIAIKVDDPDRYMQDLIDHSQIYGTIGQETGEVEDAVKVVTPIRTKKDD